MSATTYLGQAALDQIEAAQRAITRHVADAAHGRCRACAIGAPCPGAATPTATLAGYGRLPARQPGATLAEPTAPADPWEGWFGPNRGRS